jgi:glyoxylase-like metal-dependent hydrolase (beta-lactamase superfamily II)
MKLSDNIQLLGVGGVNLVLTWDDDNLVLIDAGYPGQTASITQAIAEAGFDVKNLSHIIITHQDLDHIGCVTELLELAPNAKVLAHKDEAPYMDGRETPIKLAAALAKYDSLADENKAQIDKSKDFYAQNRFKIDHELVDDEVLAICGGIRVLHTPGHTPGHIVLHLEQSGIMVCGDAANIKEGQITGPNPVHTQDMELGMKSLEKIKANIKTGLVAYHGGYLAT